MSLLQRISADGCRTAVLIDPEKAHGASFEELLGYLSASMADEILIGGSTLAETHLMSDTMTAIAESTGQPLTLFPGDGMQLDDRAESVILPVLISGRDAEYLIGEHVRYAMELRATGADVIPTGYILVADQAVSSTARATATHPISHQNEELIIRTAIAGQLIGMRSIYLEGGSGADRCLSPTLVERVKAEIDIPLIVGGGIDTIEKYDALRNVSPSLIVVGNALERRPSFLTEIHTSSKAHEARRHHQIHR